MKYQGDYGKDKSKYGIVSNMIYCFQEIWGWNKVFFVSGLFGFLFSVPASFLGIYFPAQVVAELEAGAGPANMLLVLGGFVFLIWGLRVTENMMKEYREAMIWSFVGYFQKKYIHKVMDLDYDRLQSQDSQKVMGNAVDSVNRGKGLHELCDCFEVVENVVLVLLYGALLCLVSPLLLLAVFATVLVDLQMLAIARKKHGHYYETMGILSRKMHYISALSRTSSAGKDIRIYGLSDWLLKKYNASLQEMNRIYERIMIPYTGRSFTAVLLTFLKNLFIYSYLLWMLAHRRLGVSELVFYIGLINVLTNNLERIMQQVVKLNSVSLAIGSIRELMDWEDLWKRGEGIGKEALKKLLQAPVKLELKNVSFCYPGSKTPVLSHINLTIRPGEKLALLGLNGAGKTTLVRLICGFYHPSEGRILINEIDQKQFSREEYEQIVSVLFQDATLLPVTLDENLTAKRKEGTDATWLERCLDLSGFRGRYDSLAAKGETKMIREVNVEAVDFSGGEKQKLLFARALYKRAPLLILDEPTAALDPVAERRLYLNFKDAARGATSLYISHRLSSTRFCDRIALLENGSLVEEGTHEELMRGNTQYAQLFKLQSRYYQEERDEPKGFKKSNTPD